MDLKNIWKKITAGKVGYVTYAVLGIIAALLLHSILSISFGTNFPVVVVVSGSMDHGENEDGQPCGKKVFDYRESFDNWWDLCRFYYENFNITKSDFSNFLFSNGFKRGDMPIVFGFEKYKVGDVIVYNEPTQSAPIIHRIIGINPDGSYQTKGDHNPSQNPYEREVRKSQIEGKVIFIIPKVGYFKVLFNDLLGILAFKTN